MKYKYLKKEDIPAEVAHLYAEKTIKGEGGKADSTLWVLEVDGAVDVDRLTEFRNNNKELFNENKALKEKYEGIDPEEYRDLKSKADDLRDAKLIKSGDLEKAVENRTKAMREAHAKELLKAQEESGKLTARLTEVEINQAAIAEATKKGLRPTAVQDIMARARSVFKLHEGKVVAFEQDGKTVKYGKDGITPFTISDWIETQVSEAPHLFEASSGGGAGGSGNRNGTTTGPNPWKADSYNLTQQMIIQKKDPQLANRLAAEAGVRK